MSSTLSSQSGSADLSKPGCDGAITRRSCASRSRNGTSSIMPPPPCRYSIGAPWPRSNSSRSIPATEIISLRLPLIGAERGAGLLGERRVDHVARLDLAGHPALLEEEVEVLLDAVGVHHAVDMHGLRIHFSDESRVHAEALGDGLDDLVGTRSG